ncbi:MAG: mitochondrial fission ELM1 family protein [Deltaproteobacteria bacterium]|nr:mitochondrial fission ELM1 family protein [Deltaproteobacteria bacterium]
MAKNPRKIECLILSDGRAGHVKQSQAITKLMALEQTREIKILYPSKIHEYFFSCLMLIPWPHRFLKLLLKLALKPSSFKEALEGSENLIISAGASLNAPNIALRKLKSSKNIVLMKPTWGRASQYDLQIIPNHDVISQNRANTIRTLLTPSHFDPKQAEQAALELKRNYPLTDAPIVSILIGGSTSKTSLTVSWMALFLKHLKTYLKQNSVQLLCTTSRRTPLPICTELEKNISSLPACKLLITDPSSNPIPNLIHAMLYLSSQVWITQDSISMISEALYARKKPVVLQTQPHRSRKHETFLRSLEHHRLIELRSPHELMAPISTTTDFSLLNEEQKTLRTAIEAIL